MNANDATAKIVKELLSSNPFVLDYLRRDVLNVSGLARELLPVVKKENSKATVESISIAIRRMDAQPQRSMQQLKDVLSATQITLRTDVTLLCLRDRSGLPDPRRFTSGDLFCVNQGSDEVTVIIDTKNVEWVRGKPIFRKDDLAAISLKDTKIGKPANYRVTPGFISAFLWNISREGINVEDIISTYSQVTLVVDEKDLQRAFTICKNVKALKAI